MCGKEGPLNGFAVAGEDRHFVWADATIDRDSVVVSACEISEPVAVRYAWAMNPSHRNLLYNNEGIPASPFRTDDWPLFDEGDVFEAFVNPKKPEDYEPTPIQRPSMTQ